MLGDDVNFWDVEDMGDDGIMNEGGLI